MIFVGTKEDRLKSRSSIAGALGALETSSIPDLPPISFLSLFNQWKVLNFHLWETLSFGLLNNGELNKPECKFCFFMKKFTYLTSSTKTWFSGDFQFTQQMNSPQKNWILSLNSFFTKSEHFPTVVLQKRSLNKRII